jgi:hypothetical protein
VLPWTCDFGHAIIIGVPPTPPTAPVSLRWGTADGSARAGVDFVGVTDRVQTVPAGAQRAVFVVRLLPRPKGTPERRFTVRIVGHTSTGPVDLTTVVTIKAA